MATSKNHGICENERGIKATHSIKLQVNLICGCGQPGHICACLVGRLRNGVNSLAGLKEVTLHTASLNY